MAACARSSRLLSFLYFVQEDLLLSSSASLSRPPSSRRSEPEKGVVCSFPTFSELLPGLKEECAFSLDAPRTHEE